MPEKLYKLGCAHAMFRTKSSNDTVQSSEASSVQLGGGRRVFGVIGSIMAGFEDLQSGFARLLQQLMV